MLKGNLYLTSDINVAQSAAFAGSKIILICEQSPFQIQVPNVLLGTVLLPPYQAFMAELDGNNQEFYKQYIFHLSQKESDTFLCLIVAALLKGINIVFYIPKDEMQLQFPKVLSEYLFNCFGIIVGTSANVFMYDNSFDPVILMKLYLQNIITVEEFIMLYQGPYQEIVLSKVLYELGLNGKDLATDAAYINNLKLKSISAGKFLKPVIKRC
jgi:hypothetical protein